MAVAKDASMFVHPETWDDFIAPGVRAREAIDGGRWLLGDLADAATTDYGEGRLHVYERAIGVSFDSLRRYRDVARAFDPATRVAALSWEAHREVAALDDREEWLRRAASGGWSVSRLRAEIEEARR